MHPRVYNVSFMSLFALKVAITLIAVSLWLTLASNHIRRAASEVWNFF